MKLAVSLKTKITVVFAFLFLFLILAALPFYNYQESREHNHIVQNYERLIQHIKKERMSREDVVKYLTSLDFTQVENPREIFELTDKSVIRRHGFEIFLLQESYYLHVLTPHFRVLLQDKAHKFQQNYIEVYMTLFVVLLFALIYYLIIKNINDTEHQLKSRKLFLRTVMHELKTPIAKGRIVSELIDDEKQKNRIITIFEKLNFLIDDFAKVEQIVSNNYSPSMYTCSIKDVVEKSINMLMLENSDNISLYDISTKKLNVDLDLFALALKNLIDNALKYSTDAKVIIQEEKNSLLVISNGSKLPKPLDEYFKPFHNDTKHKNHGMGLGIYIVNSIINMHQMDLKYEYLNQQNIFKIILEK